MRTPVFGLIVSSLLVTALVLMNYTKGLLDAFEFVILVATPHGYEPDESVVQAARALGRERAGQVWINHDPRSPSRADQAANRLPAEHAVLYGLITGRWETAA